MRQRFYPTPDWTAKWDADLQREFLKDAHDAFKTRTKALWINSDLIVRREKQETLQWIYKWGRDYQVLAMDYDQFCRYIMQDYDWRGNWPPRDPYRKARGRRRYRGWLPDSALDFRVRNHHAHVAPKVLSEEETQYREWREHKQFKRDSAKRGWSYCGRGSSRKTWAKRFSNRKERRHVRQCLHAEKEIKPHRLFVDTWLWD